MSKDALLDKMKEGIRKSGFPLELLIGSVLEKHKWHYSTTNLYEDFETGKMREMDIHASKTINGFNVNLFIECKKSSNKQIVLYAPKARKNFLIVNSFLRTIPTFHVEQAKISNLFLHYRQFDGTVPLSTNLIVMKGDNVTDDNIDFLSSINGLIKQSIHHASDGFMETNLRSIFFYILIFDGMLAQLSSSKTEDFDLKEIKYGQLKYRYKYKRGFEIPDGELSDIELTAKKFFGGYVIEILNQEYFEQHLQEIERNTEIIDIKKLKGWGVPWPERHLKGLSTST